MKEKGVAGRYALAFVESAQSQGNLEAMGGELSSFAGVYRDTPELRKILMNPAIPDANKKSIIEKVIGKMDISASCNKAVAFLLDKGRIDFIADVADHFNVIMNERLGRVNVDITSAQPVTGDDIEKLERVFTALTKKTVKMQTRTDPSLMAGLVARIGSRVYDGSLSNQLRLMKTKLEGEA